MPCTTISSEFEFPALSIEADLFICLSRSLKLRKSTKFKFLLDHGILKSFKSKKYHSTVIPRKLAVPNSRNSLTRGSDRCSLTPKSSHLCTQIRDFGSFSKPQKSRVWRYYCTSKALILEKLDLVYKKV